MHSLGMGRELVVVDSGPSLARSWRRKRRHSLTRSGPQSLFYLLISVVAENVRPPPSRQHTATRLGWYAASWFVSDDHDTVQFLP